MSEFRFPIREPYRISAYYGQQLWYGTHRGVDIVPQGDRTVIAPISGKITRGVHYQWGKYTQIEGSGYKHILAHNKAIGGWLDTGSNVTKGQEVAVVGLTGWTTGLHLHWQVYKNGQLINPLDYLEETPMNMVQRVLDAAKRKFSDPVSAYIIVQGDAEYLVVNNQKRKITSKTKTKDLEALKNIFAVWVSPEDAAKIPTGEDL